jgi:hypothetical protein
VLGVVHLQHTADKLSKALVICSSSTPDHLAHRRSIKLSTYGVMFFGTPHMGVNGAEFQAALTNICRIFVSGNSKLLRTLTRDSDQLRVLSDLYTPIARDIKTVIFYEEYETPLIGNMSMMVKFLLHHPICLFTDTARLYLQLWLSFLVLKMLMLFRFTSII